jgi:hypothetical protein
MRTPAIAAALLSVTFGLSGAGNSPFFELKETAQNGKVQVTGKNISQIPLVAYVVVAERGHRRVVWNGVYTEGDTLKRGNTVTLGDMDAHSSAEEGNLLVDYVRLADGTAWGACATEQGKQIAARFQK